jgi:ubiquinone/menaquinone biosynthesis C-methylase UbiE
MRGVIAPTLKHSQYLYEEVLRSHVDQNTKWLDLGCGHQVLPQWREREEKSLVASCHLIVGLDYDQHSLRKHRSISLRVRGQINNLPFKENCFNLVTANMVVEHLANPEIQFQEINRILKPGGIFLFHTPNAHGYPSIMTRLTPDRLKDRLIFLLDGRREEDVFETHYRANTKEKIETLAPETGFEVAQIKMLVSDAVFAVVPPIAIPELVSIRILMTESFRSWRTNIIAILKKKAETKPNHKDN